MKERRFAVKVDTRMSLKIVEKPENQRILDFCYEHCGCDMIECVHPKGLEYPYMFVCDEEFLLKGDPVINFIASYLYETHKHKNPICGDVLVMRQGYEDFELMTEEEAKEMFEKLRALSVVSLMEVTEAMKEYFV